MKKLKEKPHMFMQGGEWWIEWNNSTPQALVENLMNFCRALRLPGWT